MKFFIDTGNINEIRQAAQLAILDGVTTNPSLIVRENKPFKETILEICSIVDGPVSVEVTKFDAEVFLDGKAFRPGLGDALERLRRQSRDARQGDVL